MHPSDRTNAEPPPAFAADRPVVPWRLVVGAFLHVALPAYLLVGLACCAAGLLAGLTPAALVARAPGFSARFAVLYLVVAAAGTAAALLLDPPLRRRRRRRAVSDPRLAERQSRDRLAAALAAARPALGRDGAAVLDSIAAAGWHHADPAFQSVSADLSDLVRTSLAALATAMPERRPELAAVATDALARLDERLRELAERRGRLDEGDLRTVARYIDSRYPPADCAGDSDR